MSRLCTDRSCSPRSSRLANDSEQRGEPHTIPLLLLLLLFLLDLLLELREVDSDPAAFGRALLSVAFGCAESASTLSFSLSSSMPKLGCFSPKSNWSAS